MKRPDECKNIEEIRQEIDAIDNDIIKLFSQRFDYVKEIVKFKEKDKESIVAQERYDAVIHNRRNISEQNGLDPNVIETIFRELMNYFIREELKILEGEG